MKKRRQAGQGASGSTTLAQKLLLILFGLLLVAVVAALLEGALRLAGAGEGQAYEDPFVGFVPGRTLFVRQRLPSGEEVYVTRPEKLAFFNEQRFPAEKGRGTFRIFALGGSTTAGRPYDHQVAFANWLQLYLDGRQAGRRYEVVNAGGISYASYRIVVLMQELVRYRPDLFIVYTGHNEFLEERTYSEIIHQHPALRGLRAWLNSLRSYSLARRAWLDLRDAAPRPGTELAEEVSATLDTWTGLDQYERDEELKRSIVQHFEFNLDQMAAIARAAGAGLVLVKPISNLKDFSPFKSEHSEGLGGAERKRSAALLAEGRARLDAGDPQAALTPLRAAVALDPGHAELHFRLGRSLLELTDHVGARAALVAAKELDVAPLRALEPLVAAVEEVARRRGLALVDLPGLLERRSRAELGHDILGNEFLLDHVHPTMAVHSLIAERLLAEMERRGALAPDPGWTEERRREIFDRQVGSLDRAYYAQRDLNLGKVLGWANKQEEAIGPLLRAAEVLPELPEIHLNLGIAYEKLGRLEEAATALRRAIALAPDLSEAWFNLGTVYGSLGRREEAVAALRRAIRPTEALPLAHFNLGVLLRQGGSAAEALDSFQRVLELGLEEAEVHRQIGLAHRLLNQPEQAVAALRRALELDPRSVAARTDLGTTFGRQSRLEEAAAELTRALELDPGYAEAHYNLGVVRSAQGRLDEALAAYQLALELDPDHGEALNNLGILYGRRGQLEEAHRALARAVAAKPGYAEAHFNLGIVYENLGQPEMALAALRQALELDPDNGRFHLGLGAHYLGRGQLDLARQHIGRADELGVPPPAALLEELRRRRG